MEKSVLHSLWSSQLCLSSLPVCTPISQMSVQVIFFLMDRKHWAGLHANCLKYFFLGDVKPVKCPREWVAYRGHCYRIYRTPKVWKQAQSSCRKEDGDLTSIHNIEEYSFIVSQLGYSEYFYFFFFFKSGIILFPLLILFMKNHFIHDFIYFYKLLVQSTVDVGQDCSILRQTNANN